MTIYQKTFVGYILVINSIGYLAMCFDKIQSKRKGHRIPEITLFVLAFLCGATGVYLGMKVPVYHKTAKTKFKIGIPVLIILNLIATYYLFEVP